MNGVASPGGRLPLPDAAAGYVRLPGRRLSPTNRASLWLGADHVLVVHETMTGETYRRFFFRDIKSIVIRPTQRQGTATLVLGALAFLNLLPVFALHAVDPDVRRGAWLALGSIVWGVLAGINMLRGPTCETRFSTAVQDDVVPSLGRLRNAREVVQHLRPRILAAQSNDHDGALAAPTTGGFGS